MCQNPLTAEEKKLYSSVLLLLLLLLLLLSYFAGFIIESSIMSYIPPSLLPSASVMTAVSMSVAANAHNGIHLENEQQKARQVTIISGCVAGASST